MHAIRHARDGALALELATRAGEALLSERETLRSRHAAPQDIKAAGDAASQAVLSALLREHRPDDAVLSEEASDDLARLSAERVWIVDPLDGTREFSEEGRTDWAVHVALWESGDLVAGAVTLPAAGLSYGTHPPSPSAASPDVGRRRPLRLAVSRTRPPDFVQGLVEVLGAESVPMGSAGVKVTSILRGETDVYVHAGGQFEWDSAAPVAVAVAAGLFTSRVDGGRLCYNQPDPYLPDLLVCRPEHAGAVLDAIASTMTSEGATP